MNFRTQESSFAFFFDTEPRSQFLHSPAWFETIVNGIQRSWLPSRTLQEQSLGEEAEEDEASWNMLKSWQKPKIKKTQTCPTKGWTCLKYVEICWKHFKSSNAGNALRWPGGAARATQAFCFSFGTFRASPVFGLCTVCRVCSVCTLYVFLIFFVIDGSQTESEGGHWGHWNLMQDADLERRWPWSGACGRSQRILFLRLFKSLPLVFMVLLSFILRILHLCFTLSLVLFRSERD